MQRLWFTCTYKMNYLISRLVSMAWLIETLPFSFQFIFDLMPEFVTLFLPSFCCINANKSHAIAFTVPNILTNCTHWLCWATACHGHRRHRPHHRYLHTIWHKVHDKKRSISSGFGLLWNLISIKPWIHQLILRPNIWIGPKFTFICSQGWFFFFIHSSS